MRCESTVEGMNGRLRLRASRRLGARATFVCDKVEATLPCLVVNLTNFFWQNDLQEIVFPR